MNDGLVEDELDCAVSGPRVADLQEMKAKREPGMIGRDFLHPFQLWTTMHGGLDGLGLHEELHWERSGYSNIIDLTQQPDTITTITFQLGCYGTRDHYVSTCSSGRIFIQATYSLSFFPVFPASLV